MRDAVQQAQQAGQNATNTAAGYNSTASTIGSQLIPFESRQLMNPAGMSQQDIGAQLTSGLAGVGGANSALVGTAGKMASATRNPMGFSSALDDAARMRDKAAAGTSEGIAARNADVKLGQQKDAASTLGGLYGMSSKAGVDSAGQVSQDVDAATRANQTGWAQNLAGGIDTGANVFKSLFPKGIGG